MDEGAVIVEDRTIWPDLARKCVLATIPQSETRYRISDVAEEFGLSHAELLSILSNKDFRKLAKAEARRARELGARAGFVFRVERMTDELAEILFSRLKDADDHVAIADFIKGFVTLARAAGLDALTQAREAEGRGVNMAIQINVPQLANGKLDHLRPEDV